jgi:hypothetical protein
MAKDIAKRMSVLLMADGEFQASKLMTEATRLYGGAPVAIKLRELQALAEIACREKNLIVITHAGEVGTGAVASLTGAPKEVTKREQ